MKNISVQTDIPGPRSQQALLKQSQQESTAISYPKRLPISLAKGLGCYVEDLDGNVFIDFLSGAGSLPLGHSHPEVVAQVIEQAGTLCMGLDFPTQAKEQFTDAHLSMLPAAVRDTYRMHFCGPTGADAVEAAIKLAKAVTGGDEVISFRGGYHGCTNGALSLTGNRSMKKNVPGKMPGVHFFPYGSTSRSQASSVLNQAQVDAALLLESALEDVNSGLGNVAAIILELVQGEGGAYVADKTFVERVARVAKKFAIPLIIDEIQTGCGRTGTWYAFEQYGITPDIFVTSKGTSGIGLPSALMFYQKSLKNWPSGSHIGTFRGNQLAFVAGAKAIEVFKRDDVLGNVRERSQQIRSHLENLQRDFALVGEVRGLGLMLGVEILSPYTGKVCEVTASKIQQRALRRGLITELGGRDDTVLRVLPPLNVSAESVGQALAVLEQVLAEHMHALDADQEAGQ
ncbi:MULTISPECIES: aspartate aminotransferase family protein [Pseudomonas]|uniref:Aspartate aminotransferase family protein n=2 Tax=unclassified Pseudomonas TaxID=196821 RepID=A0AB39HWG0_9PSED|nr:MULTISPECIES: diaminobutyrate--2-oxoglutarate transaminase family protein [Pseudomonas]KJK05690.1 2,4-diaminobutyrate 4-aminotransferase [Pseudomonas sp. 5]MDD1975045.1 diaminobutyrate--2-oxoglutarate transaminase family protein [Pseudomonas putida]MDH2559259.1 diaminobutyrate--2-oxoglutarate transaminase family protein [Pseudomonas sp. Hg5Tf]QYX49815.1 diaminobutyrate--2-oxoglutarate transaminase family protein [Pseudomonas sp. S11A 273]